MDARSPAAQVGAPMVEQADSHIVAAAKENHAGSLGMQLRRLTFELTRGRKRAKPAVALRVQRRVRLHCGCHSNADPPRLKIPRPKPSVGSRSSSSPAGEMHTLWPRSVLSGRLRALGQLV